MNNDPGIRDVTKKTKNENSMMNIDESCFLFFLNHHPHNGTTLSFEKALSCEMKVLSPL